MTLVEKYKTTEEEKKFIDKMFINFLKLNKAYIAYRLKTKMYGPNGPFGKLREDEIYKYGTKHLNGLFFWHDDDDEYPYPTPQFYFWNNLNDKWCAELDEFYNKRNGDA